MNRISALLFAILGLGFCAEGMAAQKSTIPDEAKAIFHKADEVEVISILPKTDPEQKDNFHGYPVLGKTKLKGNKAKKLVESWTACVEGSDGTEASCFRPRHGIRATHDGHTVDFVVCFECLKTDVWVDGKLLKSILHTRSTKPDLNDALNDANVPLAENIGKDK